MNLPVWAKVSRQQTKASFHVLYIGCHQKVWSRFKVDLATLNDKSRKILTEVPSSLGFS